MPKKPLKKSSRYDSVEDIIVDLASLLRPPERLSVSEAASKYRYLNNQGSFVGHWDNSKAPYLREPLDILSSHSYEAAVFCGPAQSGKALSLDTPIATPSGWTTMGDIQIGDSIFDETGTVCKVTFKTEVMTNHQCFRVTFDDDTSIIADKDHLWQVDDIYGVTKVISTDEMLSKYKIEKSSGKVRYRYAIPLAKPLSLWQKELPIDPYVLGVWLGDGANHTGYLSLNSGDADEILQNIRSRGCETYELTVYQGRDIRNVGVRTPQGETLIAALLATGHAKGTDKFIPDIYLRSSIEQRRDLLKGLMDTDGTVCAKTRTCAFTTVSPDLRDGFLELLNSLGYKSRVRSRIPKYTYLGDIKTGKECWEICFTPEGCPSEVFHLARQIEKGVRDTARRAGYTSRRWIREIVPCESVPVRCIQVDSPSHLFLAGRQMVPTHNTELILNWVAYSVKCDPMDMLLFCPTQAAGRDFSVRRVDRLNRHSKAVGDLLLRRRDSDNKFDKHYVNGMMLTLSWPSVTELAGRPVPRVALTDYDRMPMDVDGDGSPFDLASKRTTTFGSFAMTLAESSPSHPTTDPTWIASTPHEAPPCEGIMSLYNRGDRRRWYWPCPHCNGFFEGRFHHLEWDKKDSPLESAETVRMICPHCAGKILPDHRHEMQQWGVWLRDGQAIDNTGKVFGDGMRTNIASFWLNGIAAAFTTWRKLVHTFINAEEEYRRTGSEDSLKKFYNTDLGEPYFPKSMDTELLPEHLKSRAESLGDRVVPEGVRFLVATVDVQKNMFVVQVHGISPGEPFDMVLIDRYKIVKSNRQDDDGDKEWVKPATYLEDWDLITEQVIDSEYPLADGKGFMRIKMTSCDSGGAEGATTNAYNYYRHLKELGKHGRFILTKGDNKPGIPRTRITFPDAGQKGRNAAARGDIPVLMLNSNALKDHLRSRLDCMTPGKGMFRWPDWLADWWYQEMCAETRGPKGWECPKHIRNEAWDLSYYCIGVCISKMLNVELLDWNKPPGWAAPWPKNDMVRKTDEPKRFAESTKSTYDFGELARKLT